MMIRNSFTTPDPAGGPVADQLVALAGEGAVTIAIDVRSIDQKLGFRSETIATPKMIEDILDVVAMHTMKGA